MTKRNIIVIDEEKCNGCGQCIAACAEGAIQLIDGKAKLISETYCDGLGACLGECPAGALRIEEREAAAFDEKAVEAHLGHAPTQTRPPIKAIAEPNRNGGSGGPERSVRELFAQAAPAAHTAHGAAGGCPGRLLRDLSAPAENRAARPSGEPSTPEVSELTHWPIQLRLLPPTASFFRDKELLLTADCVPASVPDFHRRFLQGRVMALACPKLDDTRPYLEKLTVLFRDGGVTGVKVLRMEVPCCSGLTHLAREALAASGKELPFEEVTLSLRGEVL